MLTVWYVPCVAANLNDGIVLVSTSDVAEDLNGTLFSLNATDGKVIWQLHAENEQGTGAYGLHFMPALDETYVHR